ncbi:cysteine hydrolase family protein [Desulfosediminicola sp.]|uniref:cysteine hydrolase family protein n=1 Tax=Desulfosediminicola sp. TaxID=2886825 RepID=UPI003AF25E09
MSFAVLVIDVQSGLFDPEPRPFEADVVVKNINRVTAAARLVGKPVIFIQHEKAGTVLESGTDGWKLQANLEIGDTDHYVRKTTPDSFQGTDLQQLLADYGVESLMVCGYASEFCVDTTVRRAAALGFSVHIVKDAHTTHDKEHMEAARIREHHNKTLCNIRSFGPEIRTVSSDGISFS